MTHIILLVGSVNNQTFFFLTESILSFSDDALAYVNRLIFIHKYHTVRRAIRMVIRHADNHAVYICARVQNRSYYMKYKRKRRPKNKMKIIILWCDFIIYRPGWNLDRYGFSARFFSSLECAVYTIVILYILTGHGRFFFIFINSTRASLFNQTKYYTLLL